jgi:hypothetical protein
VLFLSDNNSERYIYLLHNINVDGNMVAFIRLLYIYRYREMIIIDF